MKPDFIHLQTFDDPITLPAIGLSLQVRIPPVSTGGAATLIETTNAPGYGPPLHRHRETEVFHVLQGHYLFEVDGKRFTVGAGETVVAKGGVAHGFVNVDNEPSKQLVLILPGLDAAAFFKELGCVMATGKLDRKAKDKFSKKWGVEFLGPPLCQPTTNPVLESRYSRQKMDAINEIFTG